MDIPRTEKVLKLLREHPDGLTLKELVIQTKCKSNKDAGNSIQLLKQRKDVNIIRKAPGHYKLDVVPDKRKAENQKKYKSVIDALTDFPDGITKKELSDSFNISPNALGNRIFSLRKKGHDIQFINGKYFLKATGSISPALVAKSVSLPKENPIEKKLKIPAEYQDAYIKLSDSDKIDFADMLRKSIYYRKSAIALLESNIEVESLLSSMEVCSV